eukprot:TRINITY_DN168_c0_g1_i1.p1 TRINITY_DN168_c0_g1~~TRINITY_DN168_c0_g1_i1.p1  ORF type:complete len:368 (+),score=54.33 TRINITY_DN168_c0_g1_i1:698-1801(+)
MSDNYKSKKLSQVEAARSSAHHFFAKLSPLLTTSLQQHQLNLQQIDDRVGSAQTLSILHYFAADSTVLTVKDLEGTILRLWRERKRLMSVARSRDLQLSVSNSILNFVLFVLFPIIVLRLFVGSFVEVDWTTLLVSTGTFLVALSFAYGDSLREVFDSLYMIFAVYPFSVGDSITIDDGEILVVEQVGVLSTQFLNLQGQSVFLRNSGIVQKKITNLYKGGNASICLHVRVNWDAEQADMKMLEQKIQLYVHSKKAIFSPRLVFWVDAQVDASYFDVRLRVRLRKKWSRNVQYFQIKTALIMKVHAFINELDMTVEDWPTSVKLLPPDADTAPAPSATAATTPAQSLSELDSQLMMDSSMDYSESHY